MNNQQQIEIPLSKTKMTRTFIGSIIFVILGVWFLVNPPELNNPILGNSVVIYVIGLLSIVFFGFIGIMIFRKLFDKKAGLIINQDGIIDNTSGLSIGFIPWSEIQEISSTQVMNQKFISIVLKNPEAFMEKISNPIQKNAMKMNYKTSDSPISISSNALKTDFNKLFNLLKEKMNEYKS
ncbi:STM3941 family protein [Paenimyroides aestuarii]|uniref:Photosystem I assembly protein Ycf4 n=1 Tax=Paenimyroides aestuarii TaxID=2968490 RepID=A0ABY5NVK8_9FLAO|nr:STM3941 family protein [Paenimyroides aestuarii]UUV22575.1 hypothetical protein NPX36_05910 [Paenimyroides aestuarii]